MPQKRAPYAEFRANGHHGLSPGGQCHRPSRPVPDLNQRCRKAKKLLPRRRKPCARLVSDKYRAVELFLKNPDACTDCRLCEIEVDRRSEEHTSELQSLIHSSYAFFCFKKRIT